MVTANICTYDDLVIEAGVVKAVVITGVAIEIGQVLGRITVGGKYKDCEIADADDGSRTPRCVALADADATLGDVTIPALFAGKVNENELVFEGVDTLSDHFNNLCDAGIYPMPAMDP